MRIGLGIGPGVGLGLGVGLAAGDNPPPSRFVKTGGTDGLYDAQAYSSVAYTGLVSVTFKISPVSGGGDAFAIGLSADNPDGSYTGIDFALLNDVGTMYHAENGVLTVIGATVPGDIWRVERDAGGVVTYYNGSTPVMSPGSTAAPLIVDCSLRFSGDTISRIIVSNPVPVPVVWVTSGVTASLE